MVTCLLTPEQHGVQSFMKKFMTGHACDAKKLLWTHPEKLCLPSSHAETLWHRLLKSEGKCTCINRESLTCSNIFAAI